MNALSAQEVLAHFGAENITQRGDELWHSCLIDRVRPHHSNGDRNPTAIINTDKMVYYCYSLREGGSVQWLFRQMGESSVGIKSSKPKKTVAQQIHDALHPDVPVEEPITKFSDLVLTPWLKDQHPYLTETRGISDQTQERYRVGYDSDTKQIVIPHFWEGRLVGWQKRRIDKGPWHHADSSLPKYQNSKGFPKTRTIFNFDTVRARNSSAIVVESVLSVLKAESWFDQGHAEWSGVLSTFGAGASDDQLGFLSGFQSITLWMENDPAGRAATHKLINALKVPCRVSVVESPPGMDLADMSREQATELFEDRKPWFRLVNRYR